MLKIWSVGLAPPVDSEHSESPPVGLITPEREEPLIVNHTGTMSFKFPVHVEILQNNLMLCFVEISSFIESYLCDVDPQKYMFQKNIEIGHGGALAEIFSDSEIEGVNRFKSLKKQVEWMCGRLAVKHLMVSQKIVTLKMTEIEIGYQPHGAPFLKVNPRLPVSISHSGNLAVCCSSRKQGIFPPGVDLERMEERDMKYILDVAFSDREKKEMADASDQEVYRVWTIKEAFLKYIREGFNENLKVCEILGNTIFHRSVPQDALRLESWVVNGEYMFSMVK